MRSDRQTYPSRGGDIRSYSQYTGTQQTQEVSTARGLSGQHGRKVRTGKDGIPIVSNNMQQSPLDIYELGAVLHEVFRGDVTEQRDGILSDESFLRRFRTSDMTAIESRIDYVLNCFQYPEISGETVIDLVSLFRCQNAAKCKKLVSRINSAINPGSINMEEFKAFRERDLQYRMARIAGLGYDIAVFFSHLVPLFESEMAGGCLDISRYSQDHSQGKGNHAMVLDVVKQHFPADASEVTAHLVVQMVQLFQGPSLRLVKRAIDAVNGLWADPHRPHALTYQQAVLLRKIYRSPRTTASTGAIDVCVSVTSSACVQEGSPAVADSGRRDDGSEEQPAQKRARHLPRAYVHSPTESITDPGDAGKLLILDMNKVLLCRHRTRRQRFFVRPHAVEFVQQMGRLFGNIAVWTSGRRENMSKAVATIFGHDYADRLLFFWTQTDCTFTRPETNAARSSGHGEDSSLRTRQEWGGEYKKDLRKVWEAFPQFNQHNTVLLDDSSEKCDLNPPCTVLNPPAFDIYLHPPTPHAPAERGQTDCVLARAAPLWQYLERLASFAGHTDEFIESHELQL